MAKKLPVYNKKGVRTRCRSCGKLTKTTYACKVCGGLAHMVAIESVFWKLRKDGDSKPQETIMEAFQRARLKAIKTFMKQGDLDGRSFYAPSLDGLRATIIFDTDEDVVTCTFYYRSNPVNYPE